MAVMPNYFGTTPESALANYNFIEFATGEGIVAFYGYMTNENNASSGALTSNTSIYSHTLYTSSTGSLNLNFDTGDFNRPTIVDGTATFVLPRSAATAGNFTTWAYCNLKVVHTDGSTTSLGTASGAQVAVNGEQEYQMCVLKANLTKTQIKIGERLRLNVEYGIEVNTGSPQFLAMGHDPQGRMTGVAGVTPFGDDAADSALGPVNTKLICLVPFKVEI